MGSSDTYMPVRRFGHAPMEVAFQLPIPQESLSFSPPLSTGLP